LSSGGLFNPELANHNAVRDLLIDCRDALRSLSKERDDLRKTIDGSRSLIAALSKDAERYRAALDRIVGLCGDFDRCACGRPTGIPAVVMCANAVLAAKEQK